MGAYCDFEGSVSTLLANYQLFICHGQNGGAPDCGTGNNRPARKAFPLSLPQTAVL